MVKKIMHAVTEKVLNSKMRRKIVLKNEKQR